MKTIKVQQGSMELRMHENHVLVLPVNILTVWRAGFTWPHDALPCVLIRQSTNAHGIINIF